MSNVTSASAMRELLNKQVDSVEDYINKLRAAYISGNRVILTRTREPYRVIEALREYNFRISSEFRHWDVIGGWTSYIQDPSNPAPVTTNEDLRIPKKDNMVDFLGALLVIHGAVPPANNKVINPADYVDVFPAGCYAMMHPHFAMAENHTKNYRAIQCIKQYTAALPYEEKGKCVIFIVPIDYKTPIELEDDMAVIDFDLPSVQERYFAVMDTLADIFGDQFAEGANGEELSSFDFWANVLNASSGLTVKNFQDYLADAIFKSQEKHGCIDKQYNQALIVSDIQSICAMINKAKTDIIKRSDVLEIMEAENMDNVGGQDLLKEWIANRRNAFSAEAREFGVDVPKGIMLVGPPGTGKSVMAKAVASVLDLPLIRFDVSRVFNSLVGASEQRIRASLKLVDALEPCVLFIDEIDKVFNSGQGGTDSGISSRVLGTLLTWMQETKSQVFTVMSANRTHGLPPELLRKGRLDEIFSVTTPSKDELIEIIKIHLRKRGHGEIAGFDYGRVANAANGYVPAEVESAIKEALLHAFNSGGSVTEDMIISELNKTVPLSVAFKEDFTDMESWAKNNARPSSSKQLVDTSSGLVVAEDLSRKNRRKRVGGSSSNTIDISSV